MLLLACSFGLPAMLTDRSWGNAADILMLAFISWGSKYINPIYFGTFKYRDYRNNYLCCLEPQGPGIHTVGGLSGADRARLPMSDVADQNWPVQLPPKGSGTFKYRIYRRFLY